MDGGEIGVEVLCHLGSSGHVHQRMGEMPGYRDFPWVVVVHTVGCVPSIVNRISRQPYNLAEVHVTDLAKIPPAVDGLNCGAVGRGGRRSVYITCSQGAYPGLDGSETVAHFGPGISGKLWGERLYQLLVDGE